MAQFAQQRSDELALYQPVAAVAEFKRSLLAELDFGRELRNLQHLHTPIRGRLHEDTHILDLVATLHPTPAVAGVPAEPAVRWISERESTPRGWYAGPIGWFDAAGDGEFDVALRSCLLAGPTVWLFAGAGIMLDSDPELEYQETALKQRSLPAALGVGE